SKTKAELEVQECVRQAGRWGIEMKSFIFPRNRVGHLDVLKRHGFSCYRGPEPQWYANQRRTVRRPKAGLNRAVKRNQVFHLWFHPTDLACRKDAMLSGLERIFAYAAELRSAGKLRVKTMR